MTKGLFQWVLILTLALTASLMLAGCTGMIGQKPYYSTRDYIRDGDYTGALSYINANRSSLYGQNDVLYWLDVGLISHHAGRYRESIRGFAIAEKTAADIPNEMSSAVWPVKYPGETYELVYANFYQALNYRLTGKPDEALVEARKIDHKLKTIKLNGGGVYEDDPFIRYVLGLLYEDAGEYNDAFVSYQLAIDGYAARRNYPNIPVPQDLVSHYLSLADRLGMKQEADELKSKLFIKTNPPEPGKNDNSGEVVLIGYNAFAPRKVNRYETAIVVAVVDGATYTKPVRIALPQYEYYPTNAQYVSVSLMNASSGIAVAQNNSDKTQNIEPIAAATLESKIPGIRKNAILAASIDFQYQKVFEAEEAKKAKEDKNYNPLDLGNLLRALPALIGVMTVKSAITQNTNYLDADKRSWQTLPGSIDTVSVKAPGGIYNIRIDFYGYGDKIIKTKTINNVTVINGRKLFVTVRSSL